MAMADGDDATKWTGEPLVEPGAGEPTVTPAKAIADMEKIAEIETIQHLVTVLNIYSNTPVLSTFIRA